jgi:hypothetical protein
MGSGRSGRHGQVAIFGSSEDSEGNDGFLSHEVPGNAVTPRFFSRWRTLRFDPLRRSKQTGLFQRVGRQGLCKRKNRLPPGFGTATLQLVPSLTARLVTGDQRMGGTRFVAR